MKCTLHRILSFILLICAVVPASFSQQELRLRDQIWGSLRVIITDAETAHNLDARCYLEDSSKHPWFPSQVITYVKPPEFDFIAQGRFQINLPPGDYVLTVGRGPEYHSIERQVEIRPGEILRLNVELRRWIDMNARGWYSGDLHNHRDWGEMPQILLSEDLNLAPTLTTWIWEYRPIVTTPPPRGPAVRYVDAAHVYSVFDTEIERLGAGPGAVCLIGLESPVKFSGSLLSPPSPAFCALAHGQGGFVDAEKITWRDSAALVALGQVDSVGLVYNSFSPHGVETGWGVNPDPNSAYATPAGAPLWAMDLYYKFLNCGFRLAASAGTASGVKPTPLGYDRVYVYLPGKFSYQDWFRALKAGRSFATNGPMLFLTVNSRKPGDTIQIPAGGGSPAKPLSVHAEVSSANELDRLEIVWKGKVVNTISAPPQSHGLKADFDMLPDDTGWLVARAFEKPTQSICFAHTSPVYINMGRSSGIVPGDARFFTTWMDREIQFYESFQGFHSQSDRQEMVEMFKKARAVYERLAGMAKDTGPENRKAGSE
jgi:hypothetical protein